MRYAKTECSTKVDEPVSNLGNARTWGEDARGSAEIDLVELSRVIWRGKWLTIGMALIFSIVAFLYVLSLPNIYQARTLLAPSEDAQGNDISRMAGQLGGLASLAGLNLGKSGGDGTVAMALEVLKSRKFISEFTQNYGILPDLMAVKSWDRNNGSIIYDPEIYDADRKEWVREVSPPKKSKPSSWEAYSAFLRIFSVSQDKETGFVTLTIDHASPYVAKQWVDWLVEHLNKVMKEKDVSEAQRSVDFLHRQLTSVALADMRAIFYQLIEEQTKTIMLAEVRDEYTFTTLDPPVVAEEKIGPKRVLITLVSAILGGLVAIFILMSRYLIGSKYINHGQNKKSDE